MVCNCITMCRDFSELEGLPKYIKPSEHHPKCDNYKLIELKKISFDSASFICYPDEAKHFLETDESPEDYEIEDIRLTEDQLEALPEFQGF